MSHPRRELHTLLSPWRHHAGTVAVFSGVSNLMMLAPTLYMLQVYDRVMVSHSLMTLVTVSVITAFLLLMMGLADVFRSRLLVRLGVRLDQALSPRIFEAQLAARQASPSSSGQSLADLLELRQFLTGHGVLAFLDAPWTPIYLAVLFLLHPWLGALGCIFVLAQAALARWGHQRSVHPSQAHQSAQKASDRLMEQQLRHVEASHAMGLWPGLHQRWLQSHQAGLQAHARSVARAHGVQALSKWLRYSQQSLSLAIGAWLVIDGHISPGAMIAANVLTSRALTPVDQMVSLWPQWLSALGAYRRLDTLLQAHPPIHASPVHPPVQGHLRLSQVCAQAPGSETQVLKDIDLNLSPGEVTVVMGPSGSGKTSLVRVAIGLWSQSQGDVLLDGVALAERDRDLLGPRLGYLPQSVELLSGTVAENIARHGHIDPEQVVEAARQAHLHELILRMPMGYDTPVGHSGEQLSGGQRQRIGLARALYGHPALVVMDEPNAHLDDAGEAALAQAVQAMKERGQAVLVVTHRPGIVAQAERVVLMRDGRIHWQGTKDEFVRMNIGQHPPPNSSKPLSAPAAHHD